MAGDRMAAAFIAKQEAKIAPEFNVALVSYPPAREQWEALLSSFMTEGARSFALPADTAGVTPEPAQRLIKALRPLVGQPDAAFLWAPPLAVNGRLD